MNGTRRLRREAGRVARQIAGFPALAWDAALGRRRYDRSRDGLIRRHAGAVAPTGRAAIYLMFPRHGVLASHRLALEHLAAQGYATTIVSNASLDAGALDMLRPLARETIERPNRGYDFGGYRDGMLELLDELPALDRLLLVNDSSWFPLRAEEDWLARAEGLDVDLVGPTTHRAMPRPPVSRWREFRFAHVPEGRNFHYSSFALLFGPAILRDPDFGRFWRRYRLSDSKSRTVRRGEIGLTQWALRRGHSHAALPPPETVAADLMALGPLAMRHALDRSFLIDDRAMQDERAALLETYDGSEAWRDGAGTFLLAASARRGTVYVLCEHLARTGAPFLKKTPFVNRTGDRAELPDDAAIDPPMRGAIEAELALARADQRPDGARSSSSTPRR